MSSISNLILSQKSGVLGKKFLQTLKGGKKKKNLLIFKYLAIGKIVVFSSYKTNIRLGPGFLASFLFLISNG